MRRRTLQQPPYGNACSSSPDSYISQTMSQPPSSSPLTNSWGMVGQLEIAESSWRMRGSGRTSTAANGVSSDCRTATVRAEKPQAGASGVPFMNRITSCSSIAWAIASRIALGSSVCDGPCSAGPDGLLDIGRSRTSVGSLLDIGCSWLSVGGGLRRCVRLQRQGVDGAPDLGAEHVVDEAVRLDTAAPLKLRCGDGCAEVIAGPRVVLHLGLRARDGGLDTLLDVLGGRHFKLSLAAILWKA